MKTRGMDLKRDTRKCFFTQQGICFCKFRGKEKVRMDVLHQWLWMPGRVWGDCKQWPGLCAGGDPPSSSTSRPFSVFLWSWSNWWQLSMQLNFPHSNIYSSFALPTSAEGRGSLSTFGWWWHAFIQTVDTWFWSLLSSGTINSSTLSGKHSKFCIMVNIIPVPQLHLWTQSLCVPHDFSP